MNRRTELYLCAGLLVLLVGAAYYFFSNHAGGTVLPGVFAADTKFKPLDVQEPSLRLDLLDKIRKLEYTGTHRNIFVAAPPPPPKPAGPVAPTIPFVGPRPLPPPPPLQPPAEFFGYASQPRGGRRVGFFKNGDDIFVVAEGETFLSNFRLDRINNDSADVEEISSGRHVMVQMVQPPDAGQGQPGAEVPNP